MAAFLLLISSFQMLQANHLYKILILFSAHIISMILLNNPPDALHPKTMLFFFRFPAFQPGILLEYGIRNRIFNLKLRLILLLPNHQGKLFFSFHLGTCLYAIAEQIIGMMITLNKNMKSYIQQMNEHFWCPLKSGKEIYHSTVLIVGYGDIGYETAKRLKAFDCQIIAVKRRKQESLPYVDQIYTIDELDDILPLADYVILALPQNQSTIHLFNKEKLLLMKKDAMLINVGRGSAIVTEDLIDVLKQDHLYGAALDVVEQEPLPPTSPLWDMDNVLITPHSSGGFVWPSVHHFYIQLIIKNLHHFNNHESLDNEVDFMTGYRKKVQYK